MCDKCNERINGEISKTVSSLRAEGFELDYILGVIVGAAVSTIKERCGLEIRVQNLEMIIRLIQAGKSPTSASIH